MESIDTKQYKQPTTGASVPHSGLRNKLDLYVERVTGSGNYLRFFLQGLIFTFFKTMPTILGTYLRGRVYRTLLKGSGSSVLIEKNVLLNIPSGITMGDRVVIGESSVIDPRGRYGEIRLGNDVHIQRWCRLTTGGKQELPGLLIIEDAVYIGPYCYVHAGGKIHIGKNCLFGPRVTLIAGNHNYKDREVPVRFQGSVAKDIIIGEDVWLSAGATVLGGVTIGRGSVIGAGSVVTKDIEPYSIVAGVPAKKIGTRG